MNSTMVGVWKDAKTNLEVVWPILVKSTTAVATTFRIPTPVGQIIETKGADPDLGIGKIEGMIEIEAYKFKEGMKHPNTTAISEKAARSSSATCLSPLLKTNFGKLLKNLVKY